MLESKMFVVLWGALWFPLISFRCGYVRNRKLTLATIQSSQPIRAEE